MVWMILGAVIIGSWGDELSIEIVRQILVLEREREEGCQHLDSGKKRIRVLWFKDNGKLNNWFGCNWSSWG